MREERRAAIIKSWNCASTNLKKALMDRYIHSYGEEFSVDSWLGFIQEELELPDYHGEKDNRKVTSH